jgi:hypothetical protein
MWEMIVRRLEGTWATRASLIATWLADRGFGKPAQVLAAAGDGEDLAPIILTWGDVAAE